MKKTIEYLQKADDFKTFQGGNGSRVLILQAYGAIWHYYANEQYYPLSSPLLPDKVLIEVETKSIDAKAHKCETIYWHGKEVYKTNNNWGKQDPVWLSPFKEWLDKAGTTKELHTIIDSILTNVKKYGIKEKISQLKEVWG